MSQRDKRDSPLVASVLALQDYLTELERVGSKINSIDMTSDVDVEHIQKMLVRFAECGQGISDEVSSLSIHLQQAQARAEAVAQAVSRQADTFALRRNEQNEHLEKFRLVGEKVRELNATITTSREDPTAMASNIPFLEGRLADLIIELQDLQDSARTARMKTLEKSAESLGQSLQALQRKLRTLS